VSARDEIEALLKEAALIQSGAQPKKKGPRRSLANVYREIEALRPRDAYERSSGGRFGLAELVAAGIVSPPPPPRLRGRPSKPGLAAQRAWWADLIHRYNEARGTPITKEEAISRAFEIVKKNSGGKGAEEYDASNVYREARRRRK
jgi:hypothetical protein